MLGSIYTEFARNAWATVPGQSYTLTYDANGNPTVITYYRDTTVIFIQNLTYDANGNPTRVECVNP